MIAPKPDIFTVSTKLVGSEISENVKRRETVSVSSRDTTTLIAKANTPPRRKDAPLST
ncbi:hypothetical protein HDU67_003075, partial [Dinochytrium kinnereticum]